MEDTRNVTGSFIGEDAEIEYSLRPRTLGEYVGQEKVKENLGVFIEAAKQRGVSRRDVYNEYEKTE